MSEIRVTDGRVELRLDSRKETMTREEALELAASLTAAAMREVPSLLPVHIARLRAFDQAIPWNLLSVTLRGDQDHKVSVTGDDGEITVRWMGPS